MQIHDPNLHLRLIEMCDCYLDSDYAAVLQKLADTPSADPEEDALKYLALAILYTLTEKASKLSLKRKKDKITATIQTDGEKIALRPPKKILFDTIISTTRSILHLEKDKDSVPLCLGLKNAQLDLQVKFEHSDDKESLKFKFPSLDNA